LTFEAGLVDLFPMDGSCASMGRGASRVHIARVDSGEYSRIDAALGHALNDLPQPDWDRSKPVYVKVNGLCESGLDKSRIHVMGISPEQARAVDFELPPAATFIVEAIEEVINMREVVA